MPHIDTEKLWRDEARNVRSWTVTYINSLVWKLDKLSLILYTIKINYFLPLTSNFSGILVATSLKSWWVGLLAHMSTSSTLHSPRRSRPMAWVPTRYAPLSSPANERESMRVKGLHIHNITWKFSRINFYYQFQTFPAYVCIGWLQYTLCIRQSHWDARQRNWWQWDGWKFTERPTVMHNNC